MDGTRLRTIGQLEEFPSVTPLGRSSIRHRRSAIRDTGA